MEFKERAERIVAEGLAKVESEGRADTAFDAAWDRTREVVLEVLGEAALAIRSGGLAASAEEKGEKVQLRVDPQSPKNRLLYSGQTPYWLEFGPDYSTRSVLC